MTDHDRDADSGAADRFDRAAEDFRLLHRLAVERSLAHWPADDDAESLPSVALRTFDDGTVADEVGPAGERGADPLYATLFIEAAEERLRATAVVIGIVMQHEHTGAVHPAVAIDLEHRDVDPVTLYVMIARDGEPPAPRVVRTVPTAGRAMVFAKDDRDPPKPQ